MKHLHLASALVATSLLAFACTEGTDDVVNVGGAGGTSSGGTSSGGVSNGGMGGTAPVGPYGACAADEAGTVVATGSCNLIHDFENGFDASFDREADGKLGAGVIADPSPGADGSGTGVLEIVEDGANGTAKALRFEFAGAQEFGGAFRYQLSEGSCYDASAFEGVTFYAKATSENKDILVMAGTADNYTDLDCSEQAGDAGECGDFPRTLVTLTDTWAKYTVSFDELMPPGWGRDEAFESSRLLDLWFADAGVEDTNAIEFFIDEMAFVGGDASMCSDDIGAGGMGGMGGGD